MEEEYVAFQFGFQCLTELYIATFCLITVEIIYERLQGPMSAYDIESWILAALIIFQYFEYVALGKMAYFIYYYLLIAALYLWPPEHLPGLGPENDRS